MWIEAGQTRLEITDHEGAERAFQVALALVDLSTDAMIGLAQAQLGLEQYAGAETAASRLLEIYPDHAAARAARAEARLNLGTLERAAEDITIAISQEPDQVSHYVLRGRINEALRRQAQD